MFARDRKRRAISAYVHKVGPALERHCGRKRHYSPEEVRRAGREAGAPTDYFSYAYCIFCSHEDFDRHHKETGEPGNYDSMRGEVAEAHFGGDTSFDAGTAIETGSSHQDSVGGGIGGSDSPSDSGSVGDSGGGGGGGDGGGGGGGGD